ATRGHCTVRLRAPPSRLRAGGSRGLGRAPARRRGLAAGVRVPQARRGTGAGLGAQVHRGARVAPRIAAAISLPRPPEPSIVAYAVAMRHALPNGTQSCITKMPLERDF